MKPTACLHLLVFLVVFGASATGGAQSGEDAAVAPEPVLVPPSFKEAPPALSLPEDAAPLPEGVSYIDLLLTVAPDGSLAEAVVRVPVREDIDALALEAVSRATFHPATRDGVPIPSRIGFRLRLVPEVTEESNADPVVEPAPARSGSSSSPPPDFDVADELEFGVEASVVREPGAATRITLQAEELTTVPGTFGEPLRVVATLPGVARTPFGLGYFVVRGASFENTGFMVDGYPVPILYHFAAGPAVISSRLVERLDFYPGGYPAKFGRFSAGLISLTTAPPPANTLLLEVEVDLLRASGLAVVPFDNGKGSVALGFRRSYFDLILPLIVDDVTIAYTDWQVRADYKVSDALRLSLFYFGSDDLLDVEAAAGAGVSDETTRTGLSYGFNRVILGAELKLSSRSRLAWSATLGTDGTSVSRVEPGGFNVGADIDGTYLGQRLSLSGPLTQGLRLTAGMDVLATLYDATSSFPTPPGIGEFPKPRVDPQTSDLVFDSVQLNAAPYLEGVLDVDWAELTVGFRLEYVDYADVSRWEPEPRGVVRVPVGEALTLKLASGLFSQAPQPFQIDRSFGNPSLRPVRSWQSSVGAELDMDDAFYAETQAFYSRMFRMARTTNNVLPEEDGTLRRQIYEDDGEGRSYGLELLLRRKAEDGLYGWLSYTLAWSERFTEDSGTVPFLFDQRHTLNLALSYGWGGWRLGARFQLSSGRPDRPVLGAAYDADGDRYQAARGGFTDRLPVYHQLDVRMDREFSIGDDVEGSFYVDIINLYNSTNTEGRVYQFDFERSDPVPGIPFIATLGVKFTYE